MFQPCLPPLVEGPGVPAPFLELERMAAIPTTYDDLIWLMCRLHFRGVDIDGQFPADSLLREFRQEMKRHFSANQ